MGQMYRIVGVRPLLHSAMKNLPTRCVETFQAAEWGSQTRIFCLGLSISKIHDIFLIFLEIDILK